MAADIGCSVNYAVAEEVSKRLKKFFAGPSPEELRAREAADAADRLKTPAQRRAEAAEKRVTATSAQEKGVAACIALGMPAGHNDPLGWIQALSEAAQDAEDLMGEAEGAAEEADAWEAWAA